MADILYYSPNCWPVAEDTKDTKQTITMTSHKPRMCCVLGGRDLVESLVIIRSPSLSSSKVSRIFVVTTILPLFLWARIWFYRFLLRSGPGSLYAIFWLLPCNHLHPNFACKISKCLLDKGNSRITPQRSFNCLNFLSKQVNGRIVLLFGD